MRDAFGGVANLVIIVVFLVLVSGYLAFNVNYTKAFRVKNKIISALEQYEGQCDPMTPSDKCNQQILEYMNALGYDSPYLNIEASAGEPQWTCNNGYCIQKNCLTSENSDIVSDKRKRAYYKVVTQINIDIPIINKILPGLKIFQISGDTKPIILPQNLGADC